MNHARLVGRFVVAATVWLLPAIATAYPQYQLGKDQTCTSCHVSPSGGGLLNENGLAVAESSSTYGGAPEAGHGALVGPSWLLLGGDFRAGAGLVQDIGSHPAAFPMQGEGAAFAHHDAFSFYGTLGFQVGHSPATFLELREHWLMWQQDPGSANGLFVRVGRFMPVFGLRFVEHNDSTRNFGQAPLYGEAYGASLEYIEPGWEGHLTAFAHDPIQNSSEVGDGVAVYAEKRLAEIVAIGAEGRYARNSEQANTTGGVTAKYWLDAANVLFELEGQFNHQTFAAGGARDQIVSYLLGSWFFHNGWMLDLGLSQFDEDLNVKAVDLEAFDADLHWFVTSHWELLLTNRIQTIAFGSGGPTSGYTLFQFHYRL